MKKKIVIGMFGVVLLTGTLLGQRMLAGHAGGHGARLEMMSALLDLTEAQRETGRALAAEAKEASKPIAAQLRKGHEEMRAAVTSGQSEMALTAIAERQGVLMGQLAAVHAKQISKFYAQLTPEQKEKALKLHDRVAERIHSPWHGADSAP